MTETKDMPLEPQPDAQIEGVGAGEWFWAEVPLPLVSFSRSNYLIIYSPTEAFTKTASSPVLAAAAEEDSGIREARAWNNHSITGVPPRNPDGALETPINSISPALAIKLAPPSTSEISVSEFSYGRLGKKCLVRFSAWGENIDQAWVEHSRDGLDWARVTRFQRRQPFDFTLPQDNCPQPGEYLRGAACDVLGTSAVSDPYQVPYGTP